MSDTPVRGPVGKPSPTGRTGDRGDYTTTHQKGRVTVTVEKEVENRILAILNLALNEGEGEEFLWVHAQGPKPAHYHASCRGVDIHLRDGLTPEQLVDGRAVCVLVKKRGVTATSGDTRNNWFYLNVFPAPDGSVTNEEIQIVDTAPPHTLNQWKGKAPGTICLLKTAPAAV